MASPPHLLVALALLASLALAARVLPPHPDPADRRRLPPAFNINSGGPAVGRFVPDDPSWLVGTTDAFVSPDAVIGGAEPINLPMYRSHRFGVDATPWGYDIPVADPGTYGCTVHFAETDAASFVDGKRVFDLVLATAHDQPVVFERIDITAELRGAQFTVLTKTAPQLVVTGILSIRVVPSVGNAIISGVTCERLSDLPPGVSADSPNAPRPPPIPASAVVPDTPEPSTAEPAFAPVNVDVNCGGPAVGRFAADDFAWVRGETSHFGGPPGVVVGGAEPHNAPALISHRYGLRASAWGYTIPVAAPGVYDCSLHFAETDAASFAVGARVFDVSVNGATLRDLDVFAETGQAEFTALVRTFAGLVVADAIVVDLTPKAGDAFLAAITCAKTAELSPELAPQPSAAPDALGPQQTVTPPDMGRETLESTDDATESVTPPVPEPQVLMPQQEQEQQLQQPDAAPTDDVTISVPADEPQPPETPAETDSEQPAESDAEQPAVTATPAAGEPDATHAAAEVVVPEASTQGAPQPTVLPAVQPSPPVEPSAQAEPDSSPPAVSADEDDDGDGDGDDSLQALVEPALQPGDSELLITYNLDVSIGDGGALTREVRDAIKRAGDDGISGDLLWAVTDIRRGDGARQAEGADGEYLMDVQVLYEAEQDRERSQTQFEDFVQSGEMDERLKADGFGDVSVTLRAAAAAGDEPETASLSQTSVVAGVIVGCVLFLMVLVAVVVYFVVRRNRNHANDFDAPPPTMSESEMSSVVERTETAASIEYLDDDSTFTAATSRAGENADQMAYVKDAFGRGTDGAHGSTSL